MTPSATPSRTAAPHVSPAFPQPALADLPATPWHGDEAPDLVLAAPAAGIHLGVDRSGIPVSLPALAPRPVRVAALGDPLMGRLLACRLLAVGAFVTVRTGHPAQWSALHGASAGRLVLADTAAWPPRRGAAPGYGHGPQALVTDLPKAPTATEAPGPWTTVVHVTRHPQPRSEFWRTAELLLALEARHAATVATLRGGDAGRVTSGLDPSEIALFRADRSTVLRVTQEATERDLCMSAPRAGGR
ncbi:hypothetical protein [Streptomyces sp. CB03238]|uniref:hypothetical protein n=1 Tax=Streptomyces sp. CB03238 TaxID=1907777 RepID=UPI000A1118EA|nr:hypothetical protein [Streptomyces sp. CB03238]ORT60542.1 hypothetical protein BKD26_09270 [Streptomyces sp. CB03238]